MHPIILGELARDHVSSLIQEVDADRLARLASGGRATGLRHRTGLRLIALGNKLTCEQAQGLAGVRGGRA